jgi:hypothetical protein
MNARTLVDTRSCSFARSSVAMSKLRSKMPSCFYDATPACFRRRSGRVTNAAHRFRTEWHTRSRGTWTHEGACARWDPAMFVRCGQALVSAHRRSQPGSVAKPPNQFESRPPHRSRRQVPIRRRSRSDCQVPARKCGAEILPPPARKLAVRHTRALCRWLPHQVLQPRGRHVLQAFEGHRAYPVLSAVGLRAQR